MRLWGIATKPKEIRKTYRPHAVAQSSHNPHPQNLQLINVEHVLQTTSLQSSH